MISFILVDNDRSVGSVRLSTIVASHFFQVMHIMAGEELSLSKANLNDKGSFGDICVFLLDKQ